MSYYIPVTVLFTIQIQGGQAPYTITLKYGDGTQETFQSYSRVATKTHTYQKAGNYTPSVSVKDNIGQTATAQANTLQALAPTPIQKLSVSLMTNVQQQAQPFYILAGQAKPFYIQAF